MELTLLQCAEASLYDDNWFLTLTYDDKKLGHTPVSLDKQHLSIFNRSMRDYCRSKGVDYRFFACGEYGDNFGRPHYHLSLFGLSPSILGLKDFGVSERFEFLSCGKLSSCAFGARDENGYFAFSSPVIDSRWPYGNTKLYRANKHTFQYVAGYVVKKLAGKSRREFENSGRVPSFSCQSRPSIGRPWFDKFNNTLLLPSVDGTKLFNDTFSIADTDWKIPRIFMRWFAKVRGVDFVNAVSRFHSSLLDSDVPDFADIKRRRDFDRYSADHYKQNNKHKEIR